MSLIVQETANPLDQDFVLYEIDDWLELSDLTSDYALVKTVKHKIAVPEIIVLRKYDRLPIRDVKYSRQTLFQRDKFSCGYCGAQFDRRLLTIDHIVPRSKGGHSNWGNTVSCCRECNARKADQTPEQAGMKLLIKPKKPIWLSPLNEIKSNYVCKSWQRFMDRTLVDMGD